MPTMPTHAHPEHSDFGFVGAVNIKGVFHGYTQLSWTKDRDDKANNDKGTKEEPQHVHGGPFRNNKFRIGEGKSEYQSYNGFRPTTVWTEGGDEGYKDAGHSYKDTPYANFGPSFRKKDRYDLKDYEAKEW